MARSGAYERAKGRRSGGFVMLMHSLLNTPAWRDLGGNGAKLLVHLVKVGSGYRNGSDLHLSERDAADAIGVSRNTASRAFDELIDHGFLRPVQRGHFTVKTKLATTWRLTFLPADGRGPTHEYKQWQPVVADAATADPAPSRAPIPPPDHQPPAEPMPSPDVSQGEPEAEPMWRRMIRETHERDEAAKHGPNN